MRWLIYEGLALLFASRIGPIPSLVATGKPKNCLTLLLHSGLDFQAVSSNL
jgi:hypothetical protein